MSNIGHINMPERATNGTLHALFHHLLFSAIIKKKRVLKKFISIFRPLKSNKQKQHCWRRPAGTDSAYREIYRMTREQHIFYPPSSKNQEITPLFLRHRILSFRWRFFIELSPIPHRVNIRRFYSSSGSGSAAIVSKSNCN
jgi:hypothetical protein